MTPPVRKTPSMRRIHRYTLSRMARAFAAAFTGAAGLLGTGAMIKMLGMAPKWGVTIATAIEALPVVILQQMSFALPLACAAASTLVFSEMAQGNELLAVESAGFDARRLLRPFLPLGLAISVLAFGIQELGWGWGTDLVARAFLRDAAGAVERRFHSGEPVNLDGQGRFWLAAVGADGRRRVVFAGFARDGRPDRVFAGRLERFAWDRDDRSVRLEMGDVEGFLKDPSTSIVLERAAISVRMRAAAPSVPQGRDPLQRSILRNFRAVSGGPGAARSEKEYLRSLAGMHSTLGLILSALPLLTLGAAFGARVRFGGKAAAFGWSVLLVLLVYYPVWMASRKMIQAGSAWAGSLPYLLDAVVLVLGTFLYRRWAGGVE